MSKIFEFFRDRGWLVHTCHSCNRNFLSKKEEDTLCGWRKCDSYIAQKPAPFEKRRRFISLSEVFEKFRTKFEKAGLASAEALRMDKGFNTDLVSAGVQVFSEAFSGKTPYAQQERFIAQPCIRMSETTNLDASGSSFVNLCTESLLISIERHLELVDTWISFFSSLGLYANRLKLVYRHKTNNWGFGEFGSEQIFFVYMGEELGEASFAECLPGTENVSLSDIGFGLERVTWAANWFRCEYSDLVSNPALPGSPATHDIARAIALLACSGIVPGTRGAGNGMRKIIKESATCGGREEILSAIMFYTGFWSSFYGMSPEYGTVSAMFAKEFDKAKVDNLKAKYGVDPRREMTLVEIAEYLMYTRGITYDEIKCHIR